MIFERRRREQELDEEIHSHLGLAEQDSQSHPGMLDAKSLVWKLFGAIGFVLLIGCVRAHARNEEPAVRGERHRSNDIRRGRAAVRRGRAGRQLRPGAPRHAHPSNGGLAGRLNSPVAFQQELWHSCFGNQQEVLQRG